MGPAKDDEDPEGMARPLSGLYSGLFLTKTEMYVKLGQEVVKISAVLVIRTSILVLIT